MLAIHKDSGQMSQLQMAKRSSKMSLRIKMGPKFLVYKAHLLLQACSLLFHKQAES
jgi:hypothetical protein